MRLRSAIMALGLLAAAVGLGAGAVQAQDYPTKPVTIIVTFPAGGATDAVARYVAQGLSQRLGQQFVVENIGGANGSTGLQQAIDAAPDGYTLVHATSSTMLVNPKLLPDVKYNPETDLTPIGPVIRLYSILHISNKLSQEHNIKTVQDLVAYAKEHPGELNYGSGGIGNGSHIAAALLEMAAGIKMEHIPFQGGAASSQALIAGDIDVLASTTAEALPVIQAGNSVPLATYAAERLPSMPDLPTLKESGIDAELFTWHGLFGPAGLPDNVVQKLDTALQDLLATDESKKFFDNIGFSIMSGSHEDLADFLKTDKARMDTVLKAAGIGS